MTESLDQEIRVLRTSFWSARDPEGRAFAPLADAYRRNGELEEARMLVQDGLERHPDFATGHLVAARVARDRGDLVAARAHLDKVIDLDGHNVLALVERGAVSISEGDRDGAIEDLRAALKLEPSQSDARERLEALEAGPAWEPESESVQEAEIPETEGSIVTRTLGDLYARQGFRDRAIGVYERLVEADPGNAELEARLEELRAPPAVVEPEAPEDEESSSWTASHAAGDLESSTEKVGEPSDAPTLHATPDPAVGARPISQYFEDLLAWVPGAVPVETLAPTSGQVGGASPAPKESSVTDKSAEAQPGGAQSAKGPERAGESDGPKEEGLDDFNVWLKSLQP